MHSPLDDFPSERRDTLRIPDQPEPELRDEVRRLAPARRLVPAVRALQQWASLGRPMAATARACGAAAQSVGMVGVSMASTGVVALGRAARRRADAFRELPWTELVRAPDGRFSIVVTAAFTSACVSLLTIWLFGPGGPPGTEPLAAASPQPQAEVPPRHTIAAAPRTAAAGGAATTPAPSEAGAEPPPELPTAIPARRAAKNATSPARPPRPEPSPARGTAIADGASRLVIVTDPVGARVTINGVGWGSTPATIRYLPPGTKRIRFTRPGYLPEERIVNIHDDRAPGTLRVALRKAPKSGAR